jgi:hypothetical protein
VAEYFSDLANDVVQRLRDFAEKLDDHLTEWQKENPDPRPADIILGRISEERKKKLKEIAKQYDEWAKERDGIEKKFKKKNYPKFSAEERKIVNKVKKYGENPIWEGVFGVEKVELMAR